MADGFSNKYLAESAKPSGFPLNNHVEAVLCMADNDCATTIQDADESGDMAIDIMGGSGYVDKAVYLDVVKDNTNNRANVISKNSDLSAAVSQLVWSALGAGARNVKGILYRTTASHAIPDCPIYYTDFAEAKAANGEDFKVNLDATGIWKIRKAA